MKTFNYYGTSFTSQDAKNIGFSNLSDTQKQALADSYVNEHTIVLQNEVVEYILSKSWECSDVPFSYEDITNYEYYGGCELVDRNGDTCWEEFTDEQAREKIDHLEYLIDKYSDTIDSLQTKYDEIEESFLGIQLTDPENTKYQKTLNCLQVKIDRLQSKHEHLDTSKSNLECMDFDQQP